jgi:PAS domain S-box-containing protein
MGEGEAAELEAGAAAAEQFRRLVLAVGDYAIFLLDPTGHVATWNSGAQNIKGYSAAEAVGQHFSLFYTDEDRARDHPGFELREAAATGRFEEEGWRVRKDGTHFWANVVISAIRDDDGTLLGYAKVTRDLTARREAEEALRRANEQLARTNQELDRFAAVAAHDLQESLRTVAGFGHLLQERHAGALDDDGQAYLSHIVAAVGRMQALVDDLLGYAKAAEPTAATEPLPVAPSVDAVLVELSAMIGERGARIDVDVAPDAAVLVHARDLESVLRNLLSNAVKFADPQTARVTVAAARRGDEVRIAVRDNGIGVDASQRPRLFRPFQRLHSAADYPGTGLGLAIAQRVVERSGGAIGVDSTAGEGSTFWFTLPAG